MGSFSPVSSRGGLTEHLKNITSNEKSPPSPLSEEAVRRVQKARRSRTKFFDADLFADPAWDVLLELYAAELGQRKISVSSLCMASNVPVTTALRWIHTLENRQLLQRASDPQDGRRYFVSLTETGSRSMEAYFETLGVKCVSQM